MAGAAGKGRSSRVPLRALARVASVAAGVQFGWALQLSLLTPYVQELGIPHAWASYIWLCGPVSGMLVQPLVGHLSDHCHSPWGRRRPFIAAGALLIVVAVVVIAYAADLGHALGDSLVFRPRAISLFVLGFWILDLANNTLQGPCRALLADFTGKDHRRTRRANAFFSLFMAVGNVLGYATGAYNKWHSVFPFTQTRACTANCANLKSAFLLGILLLIITTVLSITAAEEIPWPLLSAKHLTSSSPIISPKMSGAPEGSQNDSDEGEESESEPMREAFMWEIFSALRDLPRPMWHVLLVTALTWVAWFPFVLFDTDWMGREVYRGQPSVQETTESQLYDEGVRVGALGLMLNSVVLGVTSLLIEVLCRKVGQRAVWTSANVLLFLCLLGTAVISSISSHSGSGPPSTGIIVSALFIFAILGAPLAVTYSVPYALASRVTNISGGGQGLSMGVLNLAIVMPQIIISLGSGPWDELFGGGNMPAFILGSMAALVGGLLAPLLLHKLPSQPHQGQNSNM